MRRLLATLLVLALASPAAAQPTKIRIGATPLAEFLSAYVAADQGMFARHGLDVDFTMIPLNPTIPPALMADAIQIGGVNAAVFLLALDGGLDEVAISGATRTPRGHASFAYVTRPDVPFDGAASLVGKRVAVPGLKSSVDVLFRRWLRSHDVDFAKITYIEMASASTADGLRGKSVDGAIIVEPYLTRVLTGNIAVPGARFADELPSDILGTLYIGQRDWVARHPDAIAAFRAGLAEGRDYADAHPDDARASLKRHLNLSDAVLDVLPKPVIDLSITPERLGFWIDTMQDENLLATRIDAQAAVAP
jgi:NitT/TauT family transport system substrate-binding protein